MDDSNPEIATVFARQHFGIDDGSIHRALGRVPSESRRGAAGDGHEVTAYRGGAPGDVAGYGLLAVADTGQEIAQVIRAPLEPDLCVGQQFLFDLHVLALHTDAVSIGGFPGKGLCLEC